MGPQNEASLIDFDKVLKRVGAFQRYQILAFLLLSFVIIPPGMHAVASVFEAASPDFTCDVEDTTVSNYTVVAKSDTDVCQSLGKHVGIELSGAIGMNYSSVNGLHNATSTCSGISYDTSVFDLTIVTRWDLVCGQAWMKAFSTSMFMLGNLIGVIIFGHVADRFGRKCLFWLNLVLIAISCAVAFAPSYLVFTFLRLATGALTMGILAISFTHAVEIVGVEYRVLYGVLSAVTFALGIILVAVIAFFVRNYIWLQLIISLSSAVFVLPLYWLGESPRWMLRQGKLAEAEREIQRMARINGREVPKSILDCGEFLVDDSTEVHNNKDPVARNVFVLLKLPRMRCNTLIVWFYWLVVSMVYYGLSLGAGDLAGNPFLNLALAGFVELPAMVVMYLTADRWGRKPVQSCSLFVGGAACLILPAIQSDIPWLTVALAMTGKFFSSLGFTTIYVYTTEIYPTPVRAIGLGAASMFARVGSLLAPFVADLGNLVWLPLTQIAFGGLSVLAGCLSVMLPETLGHTLIETLEDGERFAETGLTCCRTAVAAETDKDNHMEENDKMAPNDKETACNV